MFMPDGELNTKYGCAALLVSHQSQNTADFVVEHIYLCLFCSVTRPRMFNSGPFIEH